MIVFVVILYRRSINFRGKLIAIPIYILNVIGP